MIKITLYFWEKKWGQIFSCSLQIQVSIFCFVLFSSNVAMELILTLILEKRSHVTKLLASTKVTDHPSSLTLAQTLVRLNFITYKILNISCSEALITFIFSDESQFYPEVCYFLYNTFAHLRPEIESTSNALVWQLEISANLEDRQVIDCRRLNEICNIF